MDGRIDLQVNRERRIWLEDVVIVVIVASGARWKLLPKRVPFGVKGNV